MSRSFLIALLLLIAPLRLLAQIEVRGQVEDAKTKEPDRPCLRHARE